MNNVTLVKSYLIDFARRIGNAVQWRTLAPTGAASALCGAAQGGRPADCQSATHFRQIRAGEAIIMATTLGSGGLLHDFNKFTLR